MLSACALLKEGLNKHRVGGTLVPDLVHIQHSEIAT